MAESGIKQYFSDKVTDTSTTAQNGLGVLRFEGSKVYRYVKAADAITQRAVVSFDGNDAAGTDDWTVIKGSADVVTPAGVAVGAIASGSYGWIQVGGIVSCIGDGSVSALDAVVSNGDGTVDTMADGEEEQVIGFALEDDIATTYYVNVKLRGLI